MQDITDLTYLLCARRRGNGRRGSHVSGDWQTQRMFSMTLPENPAARRRRVLIVEDDSLVGIWLRAQLEKLGHEVVGEAYTAMEAATLYLGMQPDVVLMDIRLD